MAAWRYEISLLVLRTSEIFFNTQWEISYLPVAIEYPLYVYFLFNGLTRNILSSHASNVHWTTENKGHSD